MKIDYLSRVSTECAVPGCHREELQRHHRGCERMFVRHFSARAGSARYEEFSARYESFHYDDITVLCSLHHKQVHREYLYTISRHHAAVGKPMCRWTWNQAEILMQALREHFNIWLAWKSKKLTARAYREHLTEQHRTIKSRQKKV